MDERFYVNWPREELGVREKDDGCWRDRYGRTVGFYVTVSKPGHEYEGPVMLTLELAMNEAKRLAQEHGGEHVEVDWSHWFQQNDYNTKGKECKENG